MVRSKIDACVKRINMSGFGEGFRRRMVIAVRVIKESIPAIAEQIFRHMETMRLSFKSHECSRCIELEFERFGRFLFDYHTKQSPLTDILTNAHYLTCVSECRQLETELKTIEQRRYMP